MTNITLIVTTPKVAWVRNQGIPAGQPAPGHLSCPCGNAPESDFDPDNGDVECPCGRVYSWNGWILVEQDGTHTRYYGRDFMESIW